MKKISSFFVLLLYCSILFSNCSGKTESNKYDQPLVFQFNNENEAFFGFQYFENDESIGPKSILLHREYAYIADAYHNNIKRINIETGEILVSSVLSDKRSWLRDLMVFDGNLYVLTDLEINFVLDLDLNLIEELSLPNGPKYAVESEFNKLSISYLGRIFEINSEGNIVSHRNEAYDNTTKVHGKEYSLEGEYIKTSYRNFAHKNFYKPTWDYYDSINLDFNPDRLVFFVIDMNSLTLYII